MAQWIWEQAEWPKFRWDIQALMPKLRQVYTLLGHLRGTLSTLGLRTELDTALSAMTADVISSSEIEGVLLDPAQVRSSVATRLGLATEGLPTASHYIDRLVDIMMHACQHADTPLSHEMLWEYHRNLFPAGGPHVGCYRHSAETMRVISGRIGQETVHFEAPPTERVLDMMEAFIQWVNAQNEIDPILKAGIASLWFVTIHPFSDGNGRLSRTLTDKLLAQVDQMPQRFYSMTATIQKKRTSYYQILETTQHGNMDITLWLSWFLECLSEAIQNALLEIQQTVQCARFWDVHHSIAFNLRQKRILQRFMEPFEGKLTTSKYAKMAKCSTDTALRDLQELVSLEILKIEGIGRGTHYVWHPSAWHTQ